MIRRVAIVSREFPPETDFGGAGRYAYNLALGLRDRGIDVHVISQSPSARYEHTVGPGLAVHRHPLTDVGAGGAADGITLHDFHYLQVAAWAAAVGRRYGTLDGIHGFDVVEGSEYTAETLHLPVGPRTLRAIRVFTPMSYVHSLTPGSATMGVRIADRMEGVSVACADFVSAPSQLALDAAGDAWGHALPGQVITLPYDPPRVLPPRPWTPGAPLRAVFFGRLERRKGPEGALRAALELCRAGIPVELAVVGADVAEGGVSMLESRLRPLAAEGAPHGLRVRFLGRLSDDELAAERATAHVAFLPSTFESFSYVVCEALADGCLVVTGRRVGVTEHLSPAEGVLCASAEDPVVFGREAAAAVRSLGDPSAVVAAGQRALAERMSRGAVTGTMLDRWGAALEAKRAVAVPVTTPPPSTRREVRIAAIVLAYNGLGYTRRCIDGLVRHACPGLEVVLVDNASTDGTAEWAATLPAPVRVVSPGANLGVSGGRNAGLRALELDRYDAVVFLDNDTEVGPGWWEPFQAALDADPELGIVGEEGYHIELLNNRRHIVPVGGTGPVRCDLVVGYCMYLRARAAVTTGLFDEELGLFWHDDDDYCLRAQLAGWRIAHIGSRLVHHYGHVSSSGLEEIWSDASSEQASDLSTANQAYLVRKWRTLGRAPMVEGVTGPYVLVDAADAESVAAVQRGATDAVVVAVELDDTRRAAFPDQTTGLLEEIPTRPLDGGGRVVSGLTPADTAHLACFARAVAGDPAAWLPWTGGAVRVVDPVRAGAPAPEAGEALRPWLRALVS